MRSRCPMASNPHPINTGHFAAWANGYNKGKIEGHQSGVQAGRDLERDALGEQLILMAQEYGHAQFVFTVEDLESLQVGVDLLNNKLASIQTLR